MEISHFTLQPRGPFSLADQNRFFGGWTTSAASESEIVMAFPVEGWAGCAAVRLRQEADGRITGDVVGADDPDAAWRQALEVLSLDVDGTGYPAVGERDPVIGRLQREHAFLRPVLFHSAYEAACSFIIGQRIRIVQARAIRTRLAEEYGESFAVDGQSVSAFPTPQRLLELVRLPGVNVEKTERVHGIAKAALAGLLDRSRLRTLPFDVAVAEVKQLRGVGDFIGTGIVLRGAGVVDAVPSEDITLAGISRLYGVPAVKRPEEVSHITDAWRPYRTWCSVLVHTVERRARG
jgi:DNA-3-methyladenine glycosylase II